MQKCVLIAKRGGKTVLQLFGMVGSSLARFRTIESQYQKILRGIFSRPSTVILCKWVYCILYSQGTGLCDV